MNKMIMIGGGAIALVGVSVGLSLFLTGGMSKQAAATTEAAPAPVENPFKKAQYIKLNPFIVTFPSKSRPNMLQIDISASTKDEDAVEAFKQHMPVIRNNLLMLMNAQDIKTLQTNEGKEALRQKSLATIQEVMKERYGSEGIDEIFFTKFVMQ